MVYRVIIRSVIDYGRIVYESASTTQKKVLDTIQCKALTIAPGTLRETSLAALQVDCGKMPLHLRRKRQMMEFVMMVGVQNDADPIRVKARQINNEIAAPKIGSESINVKNIVAECAECF